MLRLNDEPATKSIIRLSAPEAESVVDYFLAAMYGGGQESSSSYMMNGNMIESSMIPGSTGISPSPTMIQQHSSDLYSNGNANMIASLKTHSSKFPVSIYPNLLFLFMRIMCVENFIPAHEKQKCFPFVYEKILYELRK